MVVAELVLVPPQGVCARESEGRGRGVFALRPFVAGELIERAPVLVVLRAQLEPLRGTLLDDYWYWWDAEQNACTLGWGSLYNHACPANASFALDHAGRCIEFRAARDIAAGEEITINYHGAVDDPAPTWFALR